MKNFNLILILSLFSNTQNKLLDTSNEILSRQKRFLLWKDGINWIQMIVGIGLPIELNDQSITIGTVVKAYYLLPNNSSYYTHPTIDYARKKRSTRWTTYNFLEKFLDSFGDGKACLLRSICEAAAISFEEKSGIFAEILHVILTPSVTKDSFDSYLNSQYHAAEKIGKYVGNCDWIFRECEHNILEKFTKYLS